jgi:hypothetical protein
VGLRVLLGELRENDKELNMLFYYIKQMLVLGVGYADFFILAYTPISA